MLALISVRSDVGAMNRHSLFSFLTALVCATAFAADQPKCKKSGKDCPMNDGKECNCGKGCDCTT